MFRFSRAIEIDPIYQKPCRNSALVLLLMGNTVLVLHDIERSLASRPAERGGLLLKSTILKALRWHNDAVRTEVEAECAEEDNWYEQHLLKE